MDYKSRTQKKKEAEALQVLGEKLANLSHEQIKDIDLPDDIYEAVRFAKTIKSRGARRRQMQYIGTLMRNIDPGPVMEAIRNIEEGDLKKAAAFREIETWRDELVSGNKALMEEILKQCPETDRQQLNRLVRNAIKERGSHKPPKSSRALFRYLANIRNSQSK